MFGIGIAQKIPGTAGPLRHSVCLALGRTFAFGAPYINPGFHIRKRRFAGSRWLVVLNIRKQEGKFFFGHMNIATLGAFNYRNRLAPIALARKKPIAEFVLSLSFSSNEVCNFPLS